jgi:hypothetical protein
MEFVMRRAAIACLFGGFVLMLQAGDTSDGAPRLVISAPGDGAAIPSAFVALTGSARAGSCFEIETDRQRVAGVCADTSGHFDRVIHANAGNHILRILRPQASALALFTIHFSTNPPAGPSRATEPWNLLQEGDVILSESADSSQKFLYNPRYTHAALYLGAGSSGVALVAEAVSEELAQGLGEIRAVPIERTLAWREATSVDIFRLKGGLSPTERDAVLDFARGAASRDLKFWTAAEETAALYTVWLRWDVQRDRPLDAVLFQQALDRLRTGKFSLERFNCATLVWRAFLEGSKGRIDFSDPNRIEFGGQLATAFTAAFLERLRPYFFGPDSLFRSGKLDRVAASQ